MSTRQCLHLTLLLTLSGCQREPAGNQDAPAATVPSRPTAPGDSPPSQPSTYVALIYDLQGPGKDLTEGLVEQLTSRLDPHGIEGIRVRLANRNQLEVLVPGNPAGGHLAHIKYRISQPGHLEFRITADRQRHQQLFTLLDASPLSSARQLFQEEANGTRKLMGKWVQIARGPANSTGLKPFKYIPRDDVIRDAVSGQRLSLDNFQPATANPGMELAGYLQKLNVSNIEILVFTGDGYHLGNKLVNSATSLATDGHSAIDIHFTPVGAVELTRLTANNESDPGQRRARLAIILDNRILSAPRIMEELRTEHALIAGAFDAAEAENLAAILRSGALPRQLELVFQEQRPLVLSAP
ncbi:MAG: hypothetical protein ABGX05_12730 [Pirellulaceae bacterium]